MKTARKALILGQHPATGAAESCSIYYNVKNILEDWINIKASILDRDLRDLHPGGHRHPHERHLPLGHQRLQVRRGREQERPRQPESVSAMMRETVIRL